jgi:hypothetical protein
MPMKLIDYSNCCIYKIEHIENDSLVYVGHTTNFTKRKYKHKSNCKNETSKEYNHKVYQMIRENGGWEAFNMIEVEKYSCNDKREASRRENEVMKELKANMNKIKSYCSREETLERGIRYFENNKESYKEHREKNKEMYKELRKKYYDKKKEHILEQQKQSYMNNKKQFKEKHKAYYEKNMEQVKLQSKLFRKNNQEKIKEYRKEYHQKNKEKLNLKSKLYRENKKLL